MSDGVDLFQYRRELTEMLGDAIRDNIETGYKRAQLEKQYRQKRAKAIAEMRGLGTPVSIVSHLIYNDDELADLMLKRDMADVEYRSTFEVINVLKYRYKSNEDDINREWTVSK